MPTFNVHAAKTNLSKLIRRALQGEEIIIARASKPVVRLVPVDRPHREFGALKEQLSVTDAFFEPLPDEELEAWEK